jgi:hypothetical protein
VSLKLEANLPLVVLIPAANFLRALFMSIQFYSPLSNTALSTSVRGCASRGIKYCTLALPPQNTAEAKEWEIELPVLYFCWPCRFTDVGYKHKHGYMYTRSNPGMEKKGFET